MIQTKIEEDFRIKIPEIMHQQVKVGEEYMVMSDRLGRIILIPVNKVDEILKNTSGIWQGRTDMPVDGVEYVNQLRQGQRLQRLGVIPDGD